MAREFEPTPAQLERLERLQRTFDVDAAKMYWGMPVESLLVLGLSKATGKVAWVEIVEPEPTVRIAWDTGEPR